MIQKTRYGAPSWVEIVADALRRSGCAIVEDVIDGELLAAARDGLRRAADAVQREVGAERLERAGELGVVRLPMRYETVFYRLLELPAVLAVVDATVSTTAILHLQNGLALPTLEAPPADCFQLRFHMDFRRVLNGYLCSINTLLALDEFTAGNGGTVVVPGSQQQLQAPPDERLRAEAVTVECPAGAMLVFDSTLWHAAGSNTSGRERLAVNQQFTRSYFKQQIDYVRALGDDAILAQPARTQQLLGWYTRIVSSLDEYYRPAGERLYRAGQG